LSKEVHEERAPRTVEDVKEMLVKHSNGEIQRTIQNCITILQDDHVLADAIRLNLLSERTDIVKPVGWPRQDAERHRHEVYPAEDGEIRHLQREENRICHPHCCQ